MRGRQSSATTFLVQSACGRRGAGPREPVQAAPWHAGAGPLLPPPWHARAVPVPIHNTAQCSVTLCSVPHHHPGHHWQEALNQKTLPVSQAALARRIGISSKHLNQILHGRALPSVKVTIKFATALDVSAARLWRAQADYMFEQAQRELDDG